LTNSLIAFTSLLQVIRPPAVIRRSWHNGGQRWTYVAAIHTGRTSIGRFGQRPPGAPIARSRRNEPAPGRRPAARIPRPRRCASSEGQHHGTRPIATERGTWGPSWGTRRGWRNPKSGEPDDPPNEFVLGQSEGLPIVAWDREPARWPDAPRPSRRQAQRAAPPAAGSLAARRASCKRCTCRRFH